MFARNSLLLARLRFVRGARCAFAMLVVNSCHCCAITWTGTCLLWKFEDLGNYSIQLLLKGYEE